MSVHVLHNLDSESLSYISSIASFGPLACIKLTLVTFNEYLSYFLIYLKIPRKMDWFLPLKKKNPQHLAAVLQLVVDKC